MFILWDPLEAEEENGPFLAYRVFYRISGEEVDFRQAQTDYSQNYLSIQLNTNVYYQLYDVKVQAFNLLGDGPVSGVERIYSSENTPLPAPVRVRVKKYNATAVNVTWRGMEDTVEQMRGRLRGHRVKYWRRDEDEVEALVKLRLVVATGSLHLRALQ